MTYKFATINTVVCKEFICKDSHFKVNAKVQSVGLLYFCMAWITISWVVANHFKGTSASAKQLSEKPETHIQFWVVLHYFNRRFATLLQYIPIKNSIFVQ